MDIFKFDKEISQLVILQRIELLSPVLKKIRKLFGRYLFTKFVSRYLINTSIISKKYYHLMNEEILTIKSFLKKELNILSIGSGIGGLESLILSLLSPSHFIF